MKEDYMRFIHYSVIFPVFIITFFICNTTIHAQDKDTYQVTVDNLKVRTAADASSEVVGHLQAGDNITGFNEKHGWMLTYYKGEEAWVASHYLSPVDQKESNNNTEDKQQKVQIINDAVHVRSGPGLDEAILDIANSGDTFTLLDTKNDWLQIKLKDGTKAWVASWLTDQPVETKTTEKNTKEKKKKKTSSSSSNSGTLEGHTIMLDPSHGGKDPGSIGIDGIKEKDIALDYTQTVANELEKQGATVLLTRTSDKYVSLKDRVRISESYATDAFISLHFNAFTSSDPNGVSTHYYDVNDDHELAKHVQDALHQQTDLKDRGVRQDDYHVLRKNRDTSILVELGFITNPSDVQAIQNNENASAVATAIADGLKQYFN